MPSAYITNTDAGAGATLIAAPDADLKTNLQSVLLGNLTASAVRFILGWGATPFFSSVVPANSSIVFYFKNQTGPKGTALLVAGASTTEAYAEYATING